MNQSQDDPIPPPEAARPPRQQRQQTTIDHVLNEAILAQRDPEHRRRSRRAIITGEMVMDAALPRGRLKPYWMAQCAARIIAFGIGMVGLVCGAYLANKWSSKRSEGGITVAANGMAMFIDGFVATNLLLPKTPRVSPFALICLDFVMFIAAVTTGCLVGFSDKNYVGDRPWAEILNIGAAITWTVAFLRVLFLGWSCIDRRKVKSTRRSMRRTLRAM